MTNKELQKALDEIEDAVKRKDGESVLEAVKRIVGENAAAAEAGESLKVDHEAAVARLKTELEEAVKALRDAQEAKEAAEAKSGALLARAVTAETQLLSQGASAAAGGHDPSAAGATPAPATNPECGGQPACDPALGDLTPEVARWRLKNWTLPEMHGHYTGREQYLPGDVREALKKGGV